MKESKFRWVWLALMLGAVVAGAADAPPAEAPTELRLTSGAVLRNVSVVRYQGADTVVLKHAGGVDPIRLPYIAEPGRGQLIAYKKEWQRVDKPTDKQVIRGQVFVTTAGAGSYKFAGAVIMAFPADMGASLESKQGFNLPMGFDRMDPWTQQQLRFEAWSKAVDYYRSSLITSTVTDADGNYALELKKPQAVLLVCLTTRLVGRAEERNIWCQRVPEATAEYTFNNLNLWEPKG